MPESQQLVLIQHHFLQKNLFSENQEQGSWAECSRQNIITPREHLADSCCVLSFKMPVIQSDLKILSVPLQDSYCFRKSSCLIHEIKSRSSWLSQQFPKWSCCSGWSNHSVMAVHNNAFKKKPLMLKDHGTCAIFDLNRCLWYRCLWTLNMVHYFDRYLFWSALVHSNMWSSTVWTCNTGISCSFVQLLRWVNIYHTSASSFLPNFFSLLRFEALKTILFCNQL